MSKYFGKFFGPSTRAPKFLTQLPNFLLSKFASQFKVNSICVAGRDTWNLHHKFNSQGPALRILGLRVAISKSQRPISRFLGVRVPVSQGLGFQSPGSQGLGSQVLILDYARKSSCESILPDLDNKVFYNNYYLQKTSLKYIITLAI